MARFLRAGTMVGAAVLGMTPMVASAGSVLLYDPTDVGYKGDGNYVQANIGPSSQYFFGYDLPTTPVKNMFSGSSSASVAVSGSDSSLSYLASASLGGDVEGDRVLVSSDIFFTVSQDTQFNLTGTFTGDTGNTNVDTEFQIGDWSTNTSLSDVVYKSSSSSYSLSGNLVAGDIYYAVFFCNSLPARGCPVVHE